MTLMRDKAAMDWLSIGDKLTRVVPLLTGRESIKGTEAWQAFRRVNKLVTPSFMSSQSQGAILKIPARSASSCWARGQRHPKTLPLSSRR